MSRDDARRVDRRRRGSHRLEGDPGVRRLRRAREASIANLIARVIGSSGAALAIVPLTIRHLGSVRYGIWMTLLSFLDLVAITDLGIGNALIRVIARRGAVGDNAGIRVAVATALFTLVPLSAAGALIAAVGIPLLPWGRILHVDTMPVIDEASIAALVLAVTFFVIMPMKLIQQVRQGLQEGYINGWFNAAGGVLVIGIVAVAVQSGASLPAIVGCVAAAPGAMYLLNWYHFTHKRPTLRPSPTKVSFVEARRLMRSGGLFFVLGLTYVMSYSSDNIIAAQVLGPGAVTGYAVPSRLITVAIGVVTLLVTPLWPAYAEAEALLDGRWIAAIMRRSLMMVAAVTLAMAIGFIAFGPAMIDWWSRGQVHPTAGLLVGLGVWLMLASLGVTMATLLNAMEVVRTQLLCVIASATANIVISVALTRRYGVAGLVWGTDIAYFGLTLLPFALWLVPCSIRRIGRAHKSGDNVLLALNTASVETTKC